MPELLDPHTTLADYGSAGLTRAEYDRACELLGRNPNALETALVGALWSEHCSYKSTRHLLRRLPTSGDHVLQGPGENAGVVDIGDGMAAAFKIESHNHPSAVEPYQGAATAVGGILRDIFAMGARPVGLLNSLRFGPVEKRGERRNRYLFSQVVGGIANYGNCIGVPTVGGEVAFSEAYRHNPLVNAMCVGLLVHDQLKRGSATGVGNPVLYVGAPTGRDGLNGATFASGDDPLQADRAAVQVGDPFTGKLLLEATLELVSTLDVVGVQDMGAAGLTSSAAEMAARSGTGLTLDVQLVPRREDAMTPHEVMLSESQERMLVVMPRGHEQAAVELFRRWGVHAVEIGTVTDDGVLRITAGDREVAALPTSVLVDDAPLVERPSRRPESVRSEHHATVREPDDLNSVLLTLIASPNIASKRWVFEQYDHMVQAGTFVGPGSDAAVLAVPGTDRCIALTTDCNGRWVQLDPRRGTAHAVAEAARNITCSGGVPLAVTNCLNFSNPEDPVITWQLQESVEGMREACLALATPVVSGNVSLYNRTDGHDVWPTPVIGMLGVIERHDQITSQHWRNAGSELLLLGDLCAATLHGSEYLDYVHGELGTSPPPLHLDLEVRLQQCIRSAIADKLVLSAHDVSDGGLAVALAQSAIGGSIGAHVQLSATGRADRLLFGEGASLVVLEVEPEHAQTLVERAGNRRVPVTRIGTTQGDALRVAVNGSRAIDLPLEDCAAAWEEALPSLMR